MIMTTTPSIEGHSIKEYIGIVSGEAIVGADFTKDLFARFSDILGGRAGGYEKSLRDAKVLAFEALEAQVKELGANAVVGLSIDYEPVYIKNGGMLMVAVSGTAVLI